MQGFPLVIFQQKIAAIVRHAAKRYLRNNRNRLRALRQKQIWRIYQIWIDVCRYHLMRFATDILVVEQHLRRDACLGKAEEQAVYGGTALGLFVTLKGSMGEEDVETVVHH